MRRYEKLIGACGRANARLYPRPLALYLGWVLVDIRFRLWEISQTLHSEIFLLPIAFPASALNVSD
ncbi:hypothetical protein CY34DRAFT_801232 [Suillus luteus UH-Slu-Lm8-n1]|uniref:Uncharacterized protein n=1 Tax=Suillus luteus UH-Slu-Lm8-n1 TaxID=930992 RepID=A0A0D0BRV0_9AGAM|nr:hypothetical protein CY34DRAFT_801232 [Suillus luteus UH-Slu-Lm8-n1]